MLLDFFVSILCLCIIPFFYVEYFELPLQVTLPLNVAGISWIEGRKEVLKEGWKEKQKLQK